MIIADSDVLIDSLRGRDPAKSRVALELKAGDLATTAVNAFELLSGAHSREERLKVENLLAALAILPFDEEAGRRAAEARRAREEAGQSIGTADVLIAGVCLAQSAILLTRNRDHFERIPGLALGSLTPPTP